MNLNSVFVFFLSVNLKYTNQKRVESTLPVQDRVALLKLQIAQEIKRNQFAHEKLHPIDNHDFGASYEYEDVTQHITPIMDFDERKKHGRYRMKQIKTTTEAEEEAFPKKFKIKSNKRNKDKQKYISSDNEKEGDKLPLKEFIYSSDESSSKEKVKMQGIDAAFSKTTRKHVELKVGTLSLPKVKVRHSKDGPKKSVRYGNSTNFGKFLHPLTISRKKRKSKHEENIFYRRSFVNTKYIRPEWIHCQDMVTPFLRGHKTNMTEGKKLSLSDNSVRRLLQLLGEDTSDDTLDDIFSLIYQISNLQIRLFQWEIPALKTLLNVISKEPRKVHTFRTVKAGLKNMFASWHLDFHSNTTNLLRQARLFRPPCVRITPYEGSTKTSKSVRYTKSVKPRCSKEQVEHDDDCET